MSEVVPLTVCEGVIVLDGVAVCVRVPESDDVDVTVPVIVFVLLKLFDGVCVEVNDNVEVNVPDKELVLDGVTEELTLALTVCEGVMVLENDKDTVVDGV